MCVCVYRKKANDMIKRIIRINTYEIIEQKKTRENRKVKFLLASLSIFNNCNIPRNFN